VQSVCVATTVRVGNHLLTAAEQAAGAPQRLPFVDADGAPVDPDSVALLLTAPTGTTRSFAWPTAGGQDTGVLTRQEVGRFFVDWTPDDPEDGVWRWALAGGMTLDSSQSDQDVFFVRRGITPAPAGP
jgi:hypothetical protein